jgi:hypothetical protein
VTLGADFDLLSEVLKMWGLEVVFGFLQDSKVVTDEGLAFSVGEADGGGVAEVVQKIKLRVVPVVREGVQCDSRDLVQVEIQFRAGDEV